MIIYSIIYRSINTEWREGATIEIMARWGKLLKIRKFIKIE